MPGCSPKNLKVNDQKQVPQLLYPFQNCSPSAVLILVNDTSTRLVTQARKLRLPRGPFLALLSLLCSFNHQSCPFCFFSIPGIYSLSVWVSLPLTWINSLAPCKPNRFWVSSSQIVWEYKWVLCWLMQAWGPAGSLHSVPTVSQLCHYFCCRWRPEHTILGRRLNLPSACLLGSLNPFPVTLTTQCSALCLRHGVERAYSSRNILAIHVNANCGKSTSALAKIFPPASSSCCCPERVKISFQRDKGHASNDQGG